MPYQAGSLLPEHRVRASIEADDLNNKIQDDEYASAMASEPAWSLECLSLLYVRPLAQYFGRDWLERGSADVRILRPVYDGRKSV